MNKIYPIAAFIAAVVVAGGCSSGPDEPGNPASRYADAPYAFDRPDTSFTLPRELFEISGLTVLDNGGLAAVQDEVGIVFLLDPATGALTSRLQFAGSGDYEGIEAAGESLFVLRSSGSLTELTDWKQDARDARTHKTSLTRKHDTEGLAYEAAASRLLIAAKEYPGAGLDVRRQKAIYAFDPKTGLLGPDPAIVIDIREIRSKLSARVRFRPSALAVHPDTGNLYVVSATDRVLVVLGTGGRVRRAWRLPAGLFEKPEGIAFAPNGDLFISSEGARGPAKVFRFSERRPSQAR